MKIRQREVGDVVILDVTGKIMGGPDSEVFRRTIQDLVAAGKRHLLLNLEAVSWINSTGVGILIDGFSTLQRAGGKLKLVHVSERIESLLMITKLSTIFESYPCEDEALRSFT